MIIDEFGISHTGHPHTGQNGQYESNTLIQADGMRVYNGRYESL